MAGAPWLTAFDPQLLAWRGRAGWMAAFNDALGEQGIVNAQGMPLQLVAQDALPDGQPYEGYVHATGCVPTRDNPHDFFNALLWLHLPRSKARLNALQAQAIARDGIGARRGALRDVCTLLDENGLLMIAPPASQALLRTRNWQALLVDDRAAWSRDIFVLPLGHALLEKLANPYKAITAHVMIVGEFEEALRNIQAPFGAFLPENAHGYCVCFDELLLSALQDAQALHSRTLQPLPVLGIPGWWPANEDAQFYADAAVFRPLPATLAAP
ncbi:MAG: DUF3025 domain-containing protein [Burkholderiaceae bacterium]